MLNRKPLGVNPAVAKQFISDPDSVSPEPAEPRDASLAKSVLNELKASKPEPRIRMTIDLPRDKHKRLKAIAQDNDTDLSTLVRTILDKFLDQLDEI